VKIMSIQSSVAYGYVGNSAAVFPLQRLGHEVWPVLTVHFSNHTGYGAWRGPLLDPADVREVIAGIGDRGVLGDCDAVLSGYQGDPAVGAVVLEAVDLVKAANPRAVYCCDPVMGDVGRGMFVRPGIPEFMRDTVVPQADIVTPNHFELDFLAGRDTRTLAELLDAVDHPGVGLMLDTFHMHMEEASIPEAIRLAGRRIVHFQANENHRGFPGTGATDWVGVFRALHEAGYAGPVSLEPFRRDDDRFGVPIAQWRPPHEDEDARLTASAAFIRSHISLTEYRR